jgi:hypothetical protein
MSMQLECDRQKSPRFLDPINDHIRFSHAEAISTVVSEVVLVLAFRGLGASKIASRSSSVLDFVST